MRREFTKRIRLEIVHRAMNADGQIVCENCGLVLGAKRYEIDHTIPEALVVDKTRPLTAKDGKLLGYCCHRGEDGKTAQDVAQIAKAKRQERSHIDRPRSRNPMPGSRASKWKKPFNGPAVLR